MAHTPGPWKVADRFYIFMDDDVACEVAKVCDENIDDDMLGQCDADARLIAAAPELLDALVAMREAFLSNGTDSQHSACRMADAAILKARGE
jgi:hypothetical protein